MSIMNIFKGLKVAALRDKKILEGTSLPGKVRKVYKRVVKELEGEKK